jgi:Fe-S-cluster containining protein
VRYKESDLFECRNCGWCCKGYGGTFVTERDIRTISDYVQENPAFFVKKYCRRSGGRFTLGQKPDGYCIFWDAGCAIHPVKPKMCRAWPFIESVLRDFSNWRTMAGSCPGIRIEAPEEAVLECVRKQLNSTQISDFKSKI